MNYRKATLNDTTGAAILFRELAFHIKNSSKDPYWDFEEMPLDMTEQVIKSIQACVDVEAKELDYDVLFDKPKEILGA